MQKGEKIYELKETRNNKTNIIMHKLSALRADLILVLTVKLLKVYKELIERMVGMRISIVNRNIEGIDYEG